MLINKNTKTVIIGNFRSKTINDFLIQKNFLIYDNKLLYNKESCQVLNNIIQLVKKEKQIPENYTYYIKIGKKLVILFYDKDKFFKTDKIDDTVFYEYLKKNISYFKNYDINQEKNILYCVLGGARTIFHTYDNIYKNLFLSFCLKNDIYFYLKNKDCGPKNNGGVNFVYHTLNNEEIYNMIKKYKYNGKINVNFSNKNIEKNDLVKIVNDRKRFYNWMSNDEVLLRIINFHYNLKICGEWIMNSNIKYDYIFFTRPDIKFEKQIPFYLNYSTEKIYDFSDTNFNDFSLLIPNKHLNSFFFKPFDLYKNYNEKFSGPEYIMDFCIKNIYVKTNYKAKIERNQKIKKYNICFMLIGNINKTHIIKLKKILEICNKYYYVYVFGYFSNYIKNIDELLLNKYRIIDINYWESANKCFCMANIFANKNNIIFDLVINMNLNFNINFFLENEIFYCIENKKIFFNIIKEKTNIIDDNFIMSPTDKMEKILQYYKNKNNNINDRIESKYKNKMEQKYIEKIKFTYYLYKLN